MKGNAAEIVTLPRQPRPASHTPPAEAPAELDLLRRSVMAPIMADIAAASERVQAAQAQVKKLEDAVAACKARADAALLAADREAYRDAKLDIDFDEQQLAVARAALTAAQVAHAAAHAPLAATQAEQQEFINLILVAEAEIRMERLLAALREQALPELRKFGSILARFIRQQTPGLHIERLGGMRQQLRPYVEILNQHATNAAADSELAELVNHL